MQKHEEFAWMCMDLYENWIQTTAIYSISTKYVFG